MADGSAMLSGPWQVLGIDPTVEERDIKRAYARLLKSNRPEDDPQAFQALREAYETALRIAHHLRTRALPEPDHEHEHKQEQEVEREAEPEPELEAEPEPEPAARQDEVQPARPAQPPPPAALTPSDAMEIAEQLWSRYTDTAQVSPHNKLKLLSHSEELHNLLIKEAFEVCAARHCCAPDCPSNVREAVVEHFGWQNSHAHLLQLDASVADHVVARYRADRSYDQLLQASASDPALARLLADGHPAFSLELHRGSFARKLSSHIRNIETYHQEVLHYRLNQQVFRWWQLKAESKRYHPDTFVYSVLGGIMLYACAALMLFSLQRLDDAGMPLFWVAELVSLSAGVILAFRPPRRLLAKLQSFRENQFSAIWHYHRFQPRWQQGWLAAFLPLSLLMFIPEPSTALRVAVTTGLLLTAGAALFSATANCKRKFLAAIVVLALSAGPMMLPSGFSGYGLAARMCICLCGLLQLVCGNQKLYAMTGCSVQRLGWMRGLWLIGLVPLYLAVDASSSSLVAALCWLWCCAGLLLVHSLSLRLIWLFCMVVRGLVSGQLDSVGSAAAQRVALLSAVLLLGLFMLITIRHPHYNEPHAS